jgi:hypothetical protein
MAMGNLINQILSVALLVVFIFLTFNGKFHENADTLIKYPTFIILVLMVGNVLFNIYPAIVKSK